MDEAACDAVTSLQGDFVQCESTVRECLKRLIGEGGAGRQNSLSGLQGGLSAEGCPPPGSVDL